MENNDKPLTVSRFEHENALMHYGAVNKRSMIVTVAVCITCILLTLIFVTSSALRDREWQKMFTDILSKFEAQEYGVHQFSDP